MTEVTALVTRGLACTTRREMESVLAEAITIGRRAQLVRMVDCARRDGVLAPMEPVSTPNIVEAAVHLLQPEDA